MQLKTPIKMRRAEAWTLDMFNSTFKKITLLGDGWDSNYGSEYSGTRAFNTTDIYVFRNFLLNVVKATGAPYPFVKCDVYSSFTDIRGDGIMIAEWCLGDRVVIVEAHRSNPLYMFCGIMESVCSKEFVKERVIYRHFDRKRISYIEGRFGQPFTVHTVAELNKAMGRAIELERRYDWWRTLKNKLKGIRGEINE